MKMHQHRKYSSIGLFRHALGTIAHHSRLVLLDANNKPVYDYRKQLPTVALSATIKADGIQAGFHFLVGRGDIFVQSKERVLTVEEDAYGLAAYLQKNWKQFSDFQEFLESSWYSELEQIHSFVLYGEFIGKGVGPKSGLRRHMKDQRVIFFKMDVVMESGETVSVPLSVLHEDIVESVGLAGFAPLHTILEFPTTTIYADFSNLDQVRKDIWEATEIVVKECPITKAFTGKSERGEGLVWEGEVPTIGGAAPVPLMFKTKAADSYATTTDDALAMEPMQYGQGLDVDSRCALFVQSVVSKSRLAQGLVVLEGRPVGPQPEQEFAQWVLADVLKEERDTMAASCLTEADVAELILKTASESYSVMATPSNLE